MHDITLSITVL